MNNLTNVIKFERYKVGNNKNGYFMKLIDIYKEFDFRFNDRDKANVKKLNPNLIIKCEDRRIVPGGGITSAYMIEEKGIIEAIKKRKRKYSQEQKDILIEKVINFFARVKESQKPQLDITTIEEVKNRLEELKNYLDDLILKLEKKK